MEMDNNDSPYSFTPVDYDPFERAAQRTRAPYDKANQRVSGLPDVLDVIGNRVKSGLTAPIDALTGELQVNDPETNMPTPQAMGRAVDVAALGGPSGLAGAEEGAVLGSGPMRNLYRGEYSGNKGGKFWTSDSEFARQFTQSGQENEILKRVIDEDHIYKPKEDVYAGDSDAVDKVIKEARDKGYKAVELNEGQNQPNSTYVFNKTALRLASDTQKPAAIMSSIMNKKSPFTLTPIEGDPFK